MKFNFPEIKKNFGFGCMRLPLIDGKVDMAATAAMVDTFLQRGFNYFDTAHGYLGGQSEQAVKACLTSRYPRERYVLTNKLTPSFIAKEEDVQPFFQMQLEACGVEYFDFYLMHAMNAESHQRFREMHCYEQALQLKAEGKVRHVGMSFHDSAEVLDQILTNWPEIEIVQIQYNYVDYLDPVVQSKACYEVCRKHGKPVIVMEPVKGGNLINLPQAGLDLMTAGSPASYAIRFAASPENMVMVLSGMSNQAQMEDNLSFMQEFSPVTEEDLAVIDQVRTMYQAQHRIPCTGCRYCEDGCPAQIPIPDLFAQKNLELQGKEADQSDFSRAADCLDCGQCEEICPQHLHVRQLLSSISHPARKAGS